MNFRFPWNVGNFILIYIQQDATLHSLFYLETALHVSGGTTTHHQECKQLYLQHLVFVTPLLLLATIVEELELVWVCCGWRTCSTCFGWYHHPSSGAQTTISTASDICHTVIAICHYRGRVGAGLSVLQHTPTSSNSSTIAANSNNGVTNTRCCRYSCLCSWWWVVVPAKTCRARFQIK